MVRTYLHLYPLALLRHQCDVQSLIAVGFRVVHPVAQTVGMRLIYLVYSHIYLEAFVYLLRANLRRIDDSHGEDVIYLLKGDVLVLHLVPYRVWTLHACLDFVLEPHVIKDGSDGLCE